MQSAFDCVLLVDDSPAANFMHKELIRETEFADHVVVAMDGREALDYLREGDEGSRPFPPSLILLDINMPGVDGFEFLEAFRELPDDLRAAPVIVMLTTSLDPSDRERAMSTGLVREFQNKPLSMNALEKLKELAG